MPDQSQATRVQDLSERASEPGFWQRTRNALNYVFSGEVSNEWFSPLRPLPPIVPPDQIQSVEGRQFDYVVGENLRYQPRVNEAVSFYTMRQLAEWDLLAIIISRRKDQMKKLRWSIVPRDKTKKKALSGLADEATMWWRRPDQRHTWREWLDYLMDDLLVIDAPCLFVNRDVGGKLYGFEPIDGATIKPLIDARGRRPLPPDFAYSQAIHGTPTYLYTAEQMIYKPRHLRTHKIYGYSPVEQIIVTVNTALRRQVQQLDHFTEGSVPLTVAGVPKDWNAKQIDEFTTRWNAKLAGNIAERSRVHFVPDGVTWHQFGKVDLKDEFDEWLARVACAAYGMDPSAFIKQVNKGTQETTREAALAEGLAPYQLWVEELVDECLERMGYPELCFQWQDDDAIDPKEKSEIDKNLVQAGARHPNEIRQDDGLDPLDDETISWLFAMQRSPTPVAPPEQWVDGQPPPAPAVPGATPPPPHGASAGEGGAAAPAYPAPAPKPGTPSDSTPVAGKGAATLNLGKAAAPAPINRDRRLVKEAAERIARALTKTFRKMAPDIATQIADRLPAREKGANDKTMAEEIAAALDLAAMDGMATTFDAELGKVAKDGARQGVKQLGLEVATDLPFEESADWARQRGAELVGKKFDSDGNLIDNPRAEYAISDGTRAHLQGLIGEAIDGGWSNDKLADRIADSYAFSSSRAEVIARTETARADVQGSLIGWRSTGVVKSKQWIVGESCCDECAALDGTVVGLDEQFPDDGGDGPPLHPQCRCDVSPVIDETADEPEAEVA
jgi:SPP1 gp7 family putative phage head morphogenesis protein